MEARMAKSLSDAFPGTRTERAAPQGAAQAARTEAPQPALRPGGSWKARADHVDRRVHEQQEAAKARREWAARAKARQAKREGRVLTPVFRRGAGY
jgi:hypothetical protein